MILKYGTYAHADGECSISISRRSWRNYAGERIGFIERWAINGTLVASGGDLVADLTAKIAALEAAYSEDGRDLVLYESGGAAETAHKLDSSAAVGGVVIVSGPEFPRGDKAEYATYRTYSVAAEAKFIDAGAETVSYAESITVSGTGGERSVVHAVLKGRPVRQVTAEQTPVRVVQEGFAVGRSAYPAPSAPCLPSYELADRRVIERKRPKRQADGCYAEFEISWHYEFIKTEAPPTGSVTPLI